jgi:hypothetical protein
VSTAREQDRDSITLEVMEEVIEKYRIPPSERVERIRFVERRREFRAFVAAFPEAGGRYKYKANVKLVPGLFQGIPVVQGRRQDGEPGPGIWIEYADGSRKRASGEDNDGG